MTAMPDNQAPHRLPLPDWLFDEQISTEAAVLRNEWAGTVADARCDAGMQKLATAMLRLRAQRPVRPLLARANARALRFVDSALRRSRMCRQLQTLTPQLPWRTRLGLSAGRYALAAAACLMLFMCKAGVFSAIDGMSRVAGSWSKTHFDRHIGPLS